jgi:hypothetical protein
MRLAASFLLERLLLYLLQVGADGLAKLGQVRARALTVKKKAAKLVFEKLDGPRQCRWRDVAPFGSAGEV